MLFHFYNIYLKQQIIPAIELEDHTCYNLLVQSNRLHVGYWYHSSLLKGGDTMSNDILMLLFEGGLFLVSLLTKEIKK
jgi:hypothetical protein